MPSPGEPRPEPPGSSTCPPWPPPRSARRWPADPIPHGQDIPGLLDPEVIEDVSLENGEKGLIGQGLFLLQSQGNGPGTLQPCRVLRFASSTVLRSAPPGGHWSKAMITSAPRARLDLHHPFGREEVSGPIDVALEDHPFILDLVDPGQGKDLEPPGVGEDGPSHRMKSWSPPSSRTSS